MKTIVVRLMGEDLEARSCQGDGQSGEQGGGAPGEQAQCWWVVGDRSDVVVVHHSRGGYAVVPDLVGAT